MQKMNPEIKAEWVKRLRSGQIPQCHGALGKDDARCCLGVLGDIAVEHGACQRVSWDDVETDYDTGKRTEFVTHRYDGAQCFLPESIQEWAGINSDNGAFLLSADAPSSMVAYLDDDSGNPVGTLIHLNDAAEKSFEEIADVIEEKF